MKTLCLISRLSGIAGPASFQRRLAAGLEARGHAVTYGLDQDGYQAVLVIGGSRNLTGLARARRRGIPIVQRLDGMNWIHRRRSTGMRHYLRAEVNNLLLRWVRTRLAQTVVYQSDFVKGWWEDACGAAPGRSVVIRNGVPLDVFTPNGASETTRDGTRLLVVEGAIGGGYEIGLTWAAQLATALSVLDGARRPIHLTIIGKRTSSPIDLPTSDRVEIHWLGEMPGESVPTQLRSADLLFSADLNPACPNSVIEALASGLPVVAFDTGAIGEIVDATCGAVVPYGGDPWRLEPPDIAALCRAARSVLDRQASYRKGARRRAESAFGLERMINAYLDVLGWAS
jgi:glycosyltransferase involved in cell wall biosynthesis